MREIKFRAWDKLLNKFVPIKSLVFNSVTSELEGCFIEEQGVSGFVCPIERLVLMQHTGLKDKNRKEIYFNDIIKYTDIDGKGAESCVGRVVETISYGVGLLADCAISDLWEDEDIHTFEIIGNIYKNPELLK